MSVTATQVRELAASLPGVQEGAHHGHPDFRVSQKIFATLSAAEDRAALRLPALEARELARGQPGIFRVVSVREPYGWVSVLLDQMDDVDRFAELLEMAWSLRQSA